MCPRAWIVAAFVIKFCRIILCATDGKWNEWSDWTACSVSCNNGVQTRYRACDPASTKGGKWCVGSYRQTQDCQTKVHCPVDGEWGSWSPWTACSVSCGEGSMHKYRSCSDPIPENGGKPCEGDSQESQTCFALKDCPRDGKWSGWSEWSSCSVTCGRGGSTHRYRSCNNPPPAADGQPCIGSGHRERPCQAPIECPVNGQWSEWTEWTECSVTCGTGEHRRWRGCDKPPPQFGGEDCNRTVASEMQIRSCNGQLLHCPVDGGWSDWGNWGKCHTPDCHSPSQLAYSLRERACDSPLPDHNGSMCQGTFLQAGVCLQPVNCRIDGEWSKWSEWICQEFVVRRKRICNNPPPSNGGKPCRGTEIEFHGREDDAYRELCPDFITDDEDLQNGSGSGMQVNADALDSRSLD